jgi:hypothetical protein
MRLISAQKAGCQAKRHTDRKRDANGNDARHQRRARPENDARQDIATKVVGAEPMRDGRLVAHQSPALRRRIVWRKQGREDRERNKKHDNGQAKDRAFAAEKPA